MTSFGGTKIHQRNLSAIPITLKYRKILIDFPGTDWRGELCDNHVCYPWLPDSGIFSPLGPLDSWNQWGNLYVKVGTATNALPDTATIQYAIWDIDHVQHVDTLTFIFISSIYNGIESSGNPNLFNFSPNPVKDELTIKFNSPNSDFVIEITGLRGEVLERSQNETHINVSHLVNGVYFIKVTTASGISVRKFIKY